MRGGRMVVDGQSRSEEVGGEKWLKEGKRSGKPKKAKKKAQNGESRPIFYASPLPSRGRDLSNDDDDDDNDDDDEGENLDIDNNDKDDKSEDKNVEDHNDDDDDNVNYDHSDNENNDKKDMSLMTMKIQKRAQEMTKSVRYIDKDDRKEEGFEEGMMFKRYILRDLHILFPLGSRL